MKINIACGKQTWGDFFCVDAVRHPKATREPDLLHAFEFHGECLANPLPLDEGCADEVHAYHFIEHVYRWESPAVLREFRRLLKPGGLLVLELPNLEAACRNMLHGLGDQMVMWPLYGDPTHRDPYMCHRWAYTPASMIALLQEVGFEQITSARPQTHGARSNRDMRIEARKP